jgi:hypothetical protein
MGAYTILVVIGVLVAGCSVAPAAPEPGPAPDIDATVQAAVDAALRGRERGASPIARATQRITPPTMIPMATICDRAGAGTTAVPVAHAGSGDSIAPGHVNLSATYESIGIELLFRGDANENASASLEFKRSSDGAWRRGLPLWRTDDGSESPGPAFYGSALLLEPGRMYDVRVSVADPDGVAGRAVLAGRVRTRAEDLVSTERLEPTHYVSADGADQASGTAPGSAWRTLEKAMERAPSGAVVEVGPGYFGAPMTARREPITLVARHPAVDDARGEINARRRSVIEPSILSAPSGAAHEDHAAPWRQVRLKGPKTGQAYSVWKWEDSPVEAPWRMGYAADRAGQPRRVAHWDRKEGSHYGYTMETPEGWAEVLHLNESYNYGFTSFGSDVYLRLPGDLDPREQYIWLQRAGDDGETITLGGPDIRLSGFEIRMIPVGVIAGADRGVVDRNLFLNATVSYRGVKGEDVESSAYPADHTVERNLFRDTGTWSTDPARPAIAWDFIKGAVRIGGEETPWQRVGAAAETSAIWGRGGARRLVVRRNTIEGYFNGVAGYNEGYDRYSQQDTDVYDNLIRRIADDALEPEQQAINWRVWDNRIEDVSVMLSTGPVRYGPLYIFRNEAWRLGREGVGADGRGHKGVSVVAFKYSGSSSPAARVYIVHNTFWTAARDADGGGQYAGGGPDPERFWLRNNIVRMTRYAYDAPGNGSADRWDEDYNHFATTDPVRGLSYGGTRYTTDVAAYRRVSDHGAHSNVRGNFVRVSVVDSALSDASAGILTLTEGSPFVDAGAPVPNISDQRGQYSGIAPDLGASEYGQVTRAARHRSASDPSDTPFSPRTKGTGLMRMSTEFAAPTQEVSRTADTLPSSPQVRVNSAGGGYTDSSGEAWCADTGFTGGSSTSGATHDIARTADDELYRKARYGDFSYSFAVPNGRYSVTLRFAETYWTRPGARVFDVTIESRTVLDNFDVLDEVPADTAVDKTFATDVADGRLDLTFTGVEDEAFVSAIEARRAAGGAGR